MHDLGTLGGEHSDGRGINDSGFVVGSSSTLVETHAFLYDDTMHDLGTLGGAYSDANSINSAGQIECYVP